MQTTPYLLPSFKLLGFVLRKNYISNILILKALALLFINRVIFCFLNWLFRCDSQYGTMVCDVSDFGDSYRINRVCSHSVLCMFENLCVHFCISRLGFLLLFTFCSASALSVCVVLWSLFSSKGFVLLPQSWDNKERFPPNIRSLLPPIV